MRGRCATGPVAIYLPTLGGGGAERAMVTLANGLMERGVEVDLVLASAEGPYLADVRCGVRVVDLGASRVLASLPRLIRYVRARRPRAMLSALNHANVIAIIAREMARVPIRLVVSERNSVSSDMNQVSLAKRALLLLMRWTYPRADGVLAVSHGVANDLAQAINLPRERITVVYNPVVTSALLDLATASCDHPWFSPGGPPIILGVGRLTAQKDFSCLIRAFAKVRAQHPCRLVILGEGELRADLELLADSLGMSADVALPGFSENPFAWMRRASLFVLSSRWEGLPNALIQAMACGTPVVSTNCPSGPSEILEDGRWGRLVSVGDVNAMASAMLEALNDSVHPNVTDRAKDFNVSQAVDGYLSMLDLNGRVS